MISLARPLFAILSIVAMAFTFVLTPPTLQPFGPWTGSALLRHPDPLTAQLGHPQPINRSRRHLAYAIERTRTRLSKEPETSTSKDGAASPPALPADILYRVQTVKDMEKEAVEEEQDFVKASRLNEIAKRLESIGHELVGIEGTVEELRIGD